MLSSDEDDDEECSFEFLTQDSVNSSLTQDSGYLSQNSSMDFTTSNLFDQLTSENEMKAPEMSFSDIEMRDDSETTQKNQSIDFPMMPDNGEEFSYSYRSMERIKNFWAGPSYWKFLGDSNSNAKKTLKTSKKSCITNDITLDSILNDDYEDLLVRDNGTSRQIRTCSANRNFQRQKLPEDFHVKLILFDRFSNAPDLDINSHITYTSLNSSNEDDHNESVEILNDFEPPQPQDSFKIQKLNPHFGKRVTDMKLIKNTCLSIIESESNLNDTPKVLFSTIAKKLAKLLCEMNENTSAAVIFQAVLHLANEGRINIINSENNMIDFDIMLIK